MAGMTRSEGWGTGRTLAIVLGVAALLLGTAAVVGALRNDDSGSTADPTGASPPGTPTDSASTPAPEPVDVDIPEAQKAAGDGFPALVLSDLPAGWQVEGASYHPKGRAAWRVRMRDDQGRPVILQQQEERAGQPLAAWVESTTGARQAGEEIEPKGWQTGVWQWFPGSPTRLATALPDTMAVITAPDREAARVVAQRVLTFEDD